LGDGAAHGVHLDYIVQDEQLGLAHAVNLTREFVGNDPFCVLLGDNIFQDKMEQLIRDFPGSSDEAAVALIEVSDPQRFGIALIEQGKIKRVIEKPKDPPSNLAIAGAYLFKQSIFDAIARIEPSARKEYEITDAIQKLIDAGHPVNAYTLQGWWIDAGKPDSIIQANQLVLGDLPFTPAPVDPAQVMGSCDISSRVLLGEGSQVIDSVIRGPAIIGKNAIIRGSYIGPYTAIGDNVIVENSEIDASIVMQNCKILNIPRRIDSSLIADNSQVEASTRVPAAHRLILAENSYVRL